MYDIHKRKQFTTVGELKTLLANERDDAKVTICGDDNCWIHVEEDGSVITLDNEDLDEIDEYADYMGTQEEIESGISKDDFR